MSPSEQAIDQLAAETGFSGVVRVDRSGEVELTKAYGLADRGWQIPNTIDTRFGLASGAKGHTALTVASLIETGQLALDTTARSVLGTDLPLIDDAVTIEHLLAHRSGIGDYLDEDDDGEITDYVMPVPVHELLDAEDYLRVLDGHATKFAPGTDFSYCNGGFVVLAIIAERVSGTPFHELVRQRVCDPAGLADTEFLRSDEPDGRTALGYLDAAGPRTNLLHLPIRGVGDGGIQSTVVDVHAFWAALFAGRIIPLERLADMVRPRSDAPELSKRYGLGFWLDPIDDRVMLEGYDAGVSFYTVHDPSSHDTWTVISNSSDGAWPIARLLQSD